MLKATNKLSYDASTFSRKSGRREREGERERERERGRGGRESEKTQRRVMHCFITAKVRRGLSLLSTLLTPWLCNFNFLRLLPPPPSPSCLVWVLSLVATVCNMHNYALQRPLSAAPTTTAQSAGLQVCSSSPPWFSLSSSAPTAWV